MRTLMMLLVVPTCFTFALNLDTMVCTSIAVKSSDSTYSSITVFDYNDSGLERVCCYETPVDTVDTSFCTSDPDSMEQLLPEIGIEKEDSIVRYSAGDTMYSFQVLSEVAATNPLLFNGNLELPLREPLYWRIDGHNLGWNPERVQFRYCPVDPGDPGSDSIDGCSEFGCSGEFYQKLQNVYDNDEVTFIITYKDQWSMAGGLYIFFDPDDKSDMLFLQHRTEDKPSSDKSKRAIVSHTYEDGDNAWVCFSLSGVLYAKTAELYQVIAVKTAGGRKPDVGVSHGRRISLPVPNKTDFQMQPESLRKYTISGRLMPQVFPSSQRIVITSAKAIVFEMRQ